MKTVLEALGFLLIVAAAATVSTALALFVAGCGLILAANTSERPKSDR